MRTARIVVFGLSSFTRASIPDILADFENMPSVDQTALEPDDKMGFLQNLEAVRLFVLEPAVSLKAIREATGVHPNQLYLLLSRMVERDIDGRIRGQRGLIPHKHYNGYVRKMSIQPRSGLTTSSAAGAMEQLLRKYPKILKWMNKVAKERTRKLRPGEVRAVRKPVRDLHGQWLDECAREGVTPAEWPFTYDLRGFRSFQTKLSELERGLGTVNRDPGEEPDHPPPDDAPRPALWPVAIRPFMMVQFDGHKIDVRITLRVPDPFGMETIYELYRIWILVVTEVQTKSVLGYCLAYGKEYNTDDFAEAIQAAIAPHRPVKLTIPGLQVRQGGGFPTQLQPELAYHRWQFLQFDEAKCHLAGTSLERLNETLGTWTIAGRLGEPNDRSYQERLFGLFEQSGFHQVPGSVGSNPDDPVRDLADVGQNLTVVLTLDELEQLAYVLLANLNGEKQAGLGGRTALEAMRYFTSRDSYLPQLLPVTRRHQLFLLKEHISRHVSRGKAPPHINFEGVRYTSDVLQRHPELKGQELRIYYMARDLRQVHAFFTDGSELGILTAERQWRTTPHSLRLRREILRLVRTGKLRLSAEEDPIEAYVRYKAKLAKESKKAAGALAQVRAAAQSAFSDAQHGDSPFGPKVRKTEPSAEPILKPSRPPRANEPPEMPAPVTLTKTLYF
jgi:putative transposase